MLIAGILLGLLLGLRAGGRITNLAHTQLRWVWILAAAVIVRFGTEALLNANVPFADTFRVPLLATGFGLLLAGLWVNRGYPGLSLAFIGILLNALVIIRNGGYMPIWEPALTAAGFTADDVHSALHVVVGGDIGADFLLRLVILGDLIPIPIPFLQNVASLGDLFLTIGLAFFLFASVVRVPTVEEETQEQVVGGQLTGLAGSARIPRPDGALGVAPETGLAPSLQNTASLQRPLVLGAQGAGLASPALAPLPAPRPWEIDERWDDEREAHREAARQAGTQTAGSRAASRAAATISGDVGTGTTVLPPITVPRPSPETVERVRQHPYVRLALNGSFGALWAGQIISLFGDRIHQLTLAGVVYFSTNSAFAASMIFVAAFIPNLVFSPLAGTLVDRWDHKEVLIVSDLLRAAAVLLIPIAAVTNILIVYPLVFLITSISIFFRPARVAILPRIVDRGDLLTANSSLWVGETVADVIGYPIAALFVTALGAALPIAFWLDAATYVASAALLSTIVVRAASPSTDDEPDEAVDEVIADPMAIAATDPGETADLIAAIRAEPIGAKSVTADTATEVDDGSSDGFVGELKAGYRFLRGEPTLFANTIQAAVAQLSVGVLTGLMLPYTTAMFGKSDVGPLAAWAFIDTGIGAGNLIGGFVIGLIGARFAKGRMIIAGYAVWGFLTFALALTGHLGLAIGIGFGSGIANMVFLIPSQTLFQERTPARLMGRVVGFRFALVFGSMTAATVVGGVLTDIVGPTPVIAVFGLITMAAGLAGLLVPAVRDA